ncbi:hypothetical protein TD95_003401 [Thielaviopsis punctulata]|uniref:Uncharacterized protein n=1 Tax=Thielaviopsis punctulata TaxID=72032 RepID=A0A0F4ZFV1_9PEZI|nr:hypothetical protein TD95_003401 [Thielaviopsis punctulata]
MCGPDNSTRARGGALAALQPLSDRSGVQCDLTFHTPGCPSAPLATHLRLESADLAGDEEMRIIIHKSGDLSKPAHECGSLNEFEISFDSDSESDDGSSMTDILLAKPIDIGVGGDGVIGRRISLVMDGECIAQGIIGFNF